MLYKLKQEMPEICFGFTKSKNINESYESNVFPEINVVPIKKNEIVLRLSQELYFGRNTFSKEKPKKENFIEGPYLRCLIRNQIAFVHSNYIEEI